MICRISKIKPLDGFRLCVCFDGGREVCYDLNDDIARTPNFADLKDIPGLFRNVRLDSSRTVVYWNDRIDLPSDVIFEYGVEVT